MEQNKDLFARKKVPELNVPKASARRRYLSKEEMEVIRKRVQAEEQRTMAAQRLEEQRKNARVIKRGQAL